MSDYLGLQAVHYASIGGMETVVQTLLDRGVDVEVGGERDGCGGGKVGGERGQGGRGWGGEGSRWDREGRLRKE